MRPVPSQMDSAWESGLYVGDNAPCVRLTIGQWYMAETTVPGNVYRSALFDQVSLPVEIPNIQKWSWTRSTNQAAATFTATLLNVVAYPPGVAAQLLAAGKLQTGMEQGAYTPRYGGQSFGVNTSPGYGTLLPRVARQAIANPPWQATIVPDMMIKSYEGYGCDPAVAPESDPHLVQTGIWLVDTVVFGVDGSITVSGRDLGRLLVDTSSVFPNVPSDWYPLSFDVFKDTPAVTAQEPVMQAGNGALKPGHSSNLVHNGDRPEYGHSLAAAFDNDRSTYWLSVGNAYPNADFCFEYVEGDCAAGTISAVSVDVVKGPYTAYVSVFANGAWQGSKVVPYNPDDPNSGPNGANIPYLVAGTAQADRATTFALPTPVDGATKVRVCLSNLQNFHLGPYVYRAGIRTLSASYSRQVGTQTVVLKPAMHTGNYADFTDLIKLFCVWSGFYWPTHDAMFLNSDNTIVMENAPNTDPVLKEGRAWGDMQQTGTAGLVSLTTDIWDHKTMADCIQYIADMIGFNFFIGDLGGAVWRVPNWYMTGNYLELDAPGNGALYPRTNQTVLIDEDKQLLDLSVTLSSMNVRELVAVSDVAGKIGSVVQGFNPNPDDQVRIGVYADQRFASDQECQVMAEMIALQQMFTYRTDKVVIPGYPRIQIDDQVILKERVTQEYYRHYVVGIQDDLDLSSGEWTYTLSTQWLGTQPFENWAFEFQQLTAATQQYLATLIQPPQFPTSGLPNG